MDFFMCFFSDKTIKRKCTLRLCKIIVLKIPFYLFFFLKEILTLLAIRVFQE
jgi:hypothetical protein